MAGRGAKDPRKTLTPAQRMRQSIKRKAEEAGATETTPEGGYGAILGLLPGAGAAARGISAAARAARAARAAKTAKSAKAPAKKSARQKLEERGKESAGGKADELMAEEVAKKQNVYPNVPKSASQKKVAAARKGMEKEERIKKTIGSGATAAAAGAATASKDSSKKDVPTPKRKPAAPAKEAKDIPVSKREGEAFKGLEEKPKARPTPQMRASMPSEKAPPSKKDSGGQDDWLKDYMATRMEIGQKAGGRVGKVKKYAKGGKIGRGCGAAMRGGGKVMR